MRGAAALGLAIVAAHAAGFVALAGRSAGHDLAIELSSPLAAPTRTLDGAVPGALAERVDHTHDGDGPGLRRDRWTVRYRGGFTREVGATQLVGPFQDPAAPACSGRVVIGQRLLDDGHASPGTLAAALAALIDRELRGETFFPAGAYQRLEHLTARWTRLEAHPLDAALVAGAPHGYARVSATVVFDRVAVPIAVALVPERTGTGLRVRIQAHAELAFDNRVAQWVSDKLGGDQLATRLARRQLDDVLVTTLAPPPPFELPGGQQLQFTYCDSPIEIVEGTYAVVPFAVAIGRLASAPQILPPRLGPGVRVAPADPTLAIDLDVDALDAILYELWRTGWLDRRLADLGLDRRFNTDPIVTEYLSVRLSPVVLALPPVIEPGPHGTLRLAADARVAIADGTRTTTGRVWGAVDFRIAAPSRAVTVALGGLELACERTPTTLVPCYGDLVAALRDRGPDFQAGLTEAFAGLIAAIFVDRHLGSTGLPAELAIRSAVPSLAGDARSLHLELDAAVR